MAAFHSTVPAVPDRTEICRRSALASALQTLAMGSEFGLLDGELAKVLLVSDYIEWLAFERLVFAPEDLDLLFERLVPGAQIVFCHSEQATTGEALPLGPCPSSR